MLSMSFKGVRGLPHSPDVSSVGEEKEVWSIEVRHGTQQRRTRSIKLARSADERDFVGTSGSGARWEEEVEIYDKEGQETVEISLLFEGAPGVAGAIFGWGSNRCRRYHHSRATVEMRSFRSQPEESITTWLPLRSVSSNCDKDAGAIKVKFSYSDDCVPQGCLYNLLCGLVPLPLADLRTSDIPDGRKHPEITESETHGQRPSTRPSSPTEIDLFVAPGNECVELFVAPGNESVSTGAKLPESASQIAASLQERRRVHFGPVSELSFRDCVEVEAGAA